MKIPGQTRSSSSGLTSHQARPQNSVDLSSTRYQKTTRRVAVAVTTAAVTRFGHRPVHTGVTSGYDRGEAGRVAGCFAGRNILVGEVEGLRELTAKISRQVERGDLTYRLGGDDAAR